MEREFSGLDANRIHDALHLLSDQNNLHYQVNYVFTYIPTGLLKSILIMVQP